MPISIPERKRSPFLAKRISEWACPEGDRNGSGIGLMAALFPPALEPAEVTTARPLPDFAHLHDEAAS
jgi:hypothetical protein